MRQCSYCQFVTDNDNMNFCGGCGRPLPPAVQHPAPTAAQPAVPGAENSSDAPLSTRPNSPFATRRVPRTRYGAARLGMEIPEPEPAPAPAPQPSPTPAFNPDPAPAPAPQPTPTPAFNPDPAPAPAPQPTPTPAFNPSPAPAPAPQPSPTPAFNPSPAPAADSPATQPPFLPPITPVVQDPVPSTQAEPSGRRSSGKKSRSKSGGTSGKKPNVVMIALCAIIAVLVIVVVVLLVNVLGKGKSSESKPNRASSSLSSSSSFGTGTVIGADSEPQDAEPAGEATTGSAVATDSQVVFRNAQPDATITVDGVPVEFSYVGSDAVVPRSSLKDVCQVRIIAPQKDGSYETAAVWYNYRYGNDMTFGDAEDYGVYVPCDETGLGEPGAKVVDVLTWAYYTGYLNCINNQTVSKMVYSTDKNTLAQTESIFSDANAKNEYNMGNYLAVCDAASIQYNNGTVIYNATFTPNYTDRTTGASGSSTTHRTIQLVWEDGMWKVNSCVFLSEGDFNARVHADVS
ncbi:MAG: hypothetical protein ACI4OL_07110 [Gemmiger sp.]